MQRVRFSRVISSGHEQIVDYMDFITSDDEFCENAPTTKTDFNHLQKIMMQFLVLIEDIDL
jgi:hypothetical protein